MTSVIHGWPTIDDNPLGITHGAFTTKLINPQLFTDAVALGASRVRLQLSMILIEPSSLNFNWAYTDDAFQKANAAGLRITFPLRELNVKGPTSPSWADYSSPCNPGVSYWFGKESNWADFAAKFCRRYSGDGNPENAIANDGSKRPIWVDNIEVGNEDFDTHGDLVNCRNPMRYVLMARTVVPRMRLAVSAGGGGWTRRIGTWGCFWQDQTHIKNVYNTLVNPPTDATYNPGGDHTDVLTLFDYVNFHNYQVPAYGGGSAPYRIDTELDDIRAILNANGHALMPIWCTEFGQTGPAGGASPQSQSDYYNTSGGLGALRTLKNHGAQHADLYTCSYDAPNGGYLGDTKSIACLTSGGTPVRFQAFSTVQTFLKVDNGAWAARAIPLGFGSSGGGGTGRFTLTPSTLSFAATVGAGNPASQPITIDTTGTLDGTWGLAITGGAWLTASSSSGALNAGASTSVNLTAATGSLTAATYTETVTVTFTPTGQSPLTATCTVTFVVSSSSGTVYFANPGDNLVTKINALVPGDTLNLNDGSYTETHLMLISGVHGTSAHHITIQATNDGKAVVDGKNTGSNYPLYMADSTYVDVQSIIFQNSGPGSVYEFFGATGGGVSNVNIRRCSGYHAAGGNDHIYNLLGPGLSNILIEDGVASGPGRYMFSTYHNSTIIFRRCFAYWNKITDTAQEPRSCFNTYGSDHVTWENCYGINAIPYQAEAQQNYYSATFQTSDSTSLPDTATQVLGCIFVNNYEGYYLNDLGVGSTTFKDCYFETPPPANTSFTNKVFGDGFYDNGNAGSHTITNCTFRNCVTGLNLASGSQAIPVLNSVFVGNKTAITNDNSHTFCDFFDNTANGVALAASDLSVDPGYNITLYGRGGALFIPSSSALEGAGSGGADIGANILYQYVNGTLTTTPLWPWPMEGRIMAELGISPTFAANGGLFLTLSGLYTGGSGGGGGGSGGTLTGAFTALGAGTSVNLTALGTADWMHTGLTSASSVDHKSTGGSQITAPSIVGSGTPVQNTMAIVSASWSDGTPDSSAASTTTGSKMLPGPITG